MLRIGTYILYITIVYHLETCISSNSVSNEGSIHHLKKEYTSFSGQKVFVFDGIIPEEYSLSLRILLALDQRWRFVLQDEHMTDGARRYDNQNGLAWKNWHDPAPISTTKVGMCLKDVAQAVDAKIHKESRINLEMNEIYGSLIRRGDRSTLHREGTSGDRAYTMAIYHNVVWRKNDYGETFFYDDEDEIFAVVRAKFGRLVVWESSVAYMFKAPSITQLSNQMIHVVSFSANTTKNKQEREEARRLMSELQFPPDQDFVCTDNVNDRKIDMEKHLTFFRKNKRGFVLGVYDDLFPESDLYALRSSTIDNGTFFFSDQFDYDSDNVQFIVAFTVSNFMKSRFWPVVKQMAIHLSGKDTWYPYDVSCNLIRSTDHTRIHRDTSGDIGEEEEMTFLLYLSPNWTAEDFGETVFMELDNDSPRNEYVAEVVPLFGRAVIFDGDLPHSARPPSVKHYGPRFTFAVKLAIDKFTATSKMFHQEPDHEFSDTGMFNRLQGFNRNPELAVANHKLSSVIGYHQTRLMQVGLDKSMQDGEGGELKYNEEHEVVLPPEKVKLIEKMVKYYRIDESMPVDEELNENGTLMSSIFDPEKRQHTIDNWIEISSEDADVLNDYLELYLKQQVWVQSYIRKRQFVVW